MVLRLDIAEHEMYRASISFVLFQLCYTFINGLNLKMQNSNPHVCIIGAGLSGLTSARYLKDEGVNFTIIEATKYVGGTWRFDPRVGTDENGLPIFTSMYKTLRTNLPKPLMELRGYPTPADMPSYPSWNVYYEYIKSYAGDYDLYKFIKFLHLVTSVKRYGNIWKVKYKQVVTGEEFEEQYDFVIVGTSHLSKPNRPTIPGEDIFNGTIIHSHDYKVPEMYKCRRVLVVGAGPSGMEISFDLARYAQTLVHSHHSKIIFHTPQPPNYIRKPDVERFNETGIFFTDGSYEEIDDVIYATGYQYHYPFLDESSELSIRPRSVTPLFRNMVNINQPTMMIMGINVRACLVVAIDAQARYATALIKGNFDLPSKDSMMSDYTKRVETLSAKGRPLSDLHALSWNEDEYYADLTKDSGIERVPPVLFKIRVASLKIMMKNIYKYRKFAYSVLGNETFAVHMIEEEPQENVICDIN